MSPAYPPSPALSTCSEDLDAILNAAGPISRFPTPPPAKYDERSISSRRTSSQATDECKWSRSMQTVSGVCWEALSDSQKLLDHHPARLLAQQADRQNCATQEHIVNIQTILIHANLPREIIAIAYNILRSLHSHHDYIPINQSPLSNDWPPSPFFPPSPKELRAIEPDLLTTVALALAESYTNDHARTWRHWAREICCNAWTASQLDSTARSVLAALDYRLRGPTSPETVESAMVELFSEDTTAGVVLGAYKTHEMGDMDEELGWGEDVKKSSFRLAYGVVTPEASPPWRGVQPPAVDSCWV